jgi:hypothetical protein
LKAATTASNTFTYLRENIGAVLDAGFEVVLVAATSDGTDVSFEIDPSSTAVDGLHYNLNGTSVTIAPGEFSAELPITIMPDNIEVGEKWTIVVNITSADVEIGEYSSATHNIAITCESDLAGAYDYITNDAYVTYQGITYGPYNGLTGSGVIAETSIAGNYTITDVSFGVFPYIWGDSEAVGPVLVDVCDELSFSGVDQYGDSYSFISAITVSQDQTSITFSWTNTFNDTGTTTITRTDGSTWPELTNSGM